ncbi:MAG: DUF3568 family protein [Nitrospirae bacterium]|nr:DUF3568 family protein [Nitrospirota bacterium]
MKKRTMLALLLSSLIFFYGCAAVLLGVGAGVGIGAYKYVEGNLSREYPVAYTKAWDASNTALANLKIGVTNSLNNGTKGTIEAVQKDGAKVVLNLKDKGQNVTSISVRAGILGDRKSAERIHNAIASEAGL